MNNFAFAHLLKYSWTLLAAPYSFGNAFHCMPVRNTKKIPANTWRGGKGFLPPPGFRVKCCANNPAKGYNLLPMFNPQDYGDR